MNFLIVNICDLNDIQMKYKKDSKLLTKLRILIFYFTVISQVAVFPPSLDTAVIVAVPFFIAFIVPSFTVATF